MASENLEEKENFTRLSRLLVDKGTEALRNTLDTLHPPASLVAVLNANQKSLLVLKFKIITEPQWDLLYPPPSGNPPDSKTFDITLLTILLRNICGLSPPKSPIWNTIPPDTDRSIEANITRIKSFRNKVYAHATSTQVDNANFESLWQEISQALVELKIPQKDIDDLKRSPLGVEERCVAMLKDWKRNDKECITQLEVMNSSINHLTQAIEGRDEERDEDILRKLAKYTFNGKISRKVRFFHPGTTDWFMNKVDNLIKTTNDHESRMLLITAGPGFGKSVFPAKVCDNFKAKKNLAACHFCDFNDSNLRDPMKMLQSLASQMCDNVPGFKEKLLDQLKRPHKVNNLKDAFGIYLQNPLDDLESEEPFLVVIDGLDESATENRNEIVNLISTYFPEFPKWIKVLVTSRPGISVTKLEDIPKINVEEKNRANEFDIELYLKHCLPTLAANDALIQRLVRKCEGSFLYAFHLQSQLKNVDEIDKMTFSNVSNILPKGLDSIYQTYFNRLEEELKSVTQEAFDFLEILQMIVDTRKPLPLTFIARALGLAADCRQTKNIIKKVNEAVSCLLYVSDDVVTVFHKSVIDWLLGNGYEDHEYAVNKGEGCESLWRRCEQVFEEIKEKARSGHDLKLEDNEKSYALNNGFDYLQECNKNKSFFWFVDLVIIYCLMCQREVYLDILIEDWKRILCKERQVVNKDLRARISWHVLELQLLKREETNHSCYYLQSVLTHSPKGYFSDEDKEIAQTILSNSTQFVQLNSNEVDVQPLAVWTADMGVLGYIIAFGVSSTQKLVAVATNRDRIVVIGLPELVERWQYPTEYKNISCCTFTPDDSCILFGKPGTALNVAEGKEVPFFNGNNETFNSCAFSPNGKRLVTSNGSSNVTLWDVNDQRLLSKLKAHDHIYWCTFSSTGLFIIGGSEVHDEDSDCVWNAITLQRSDTRNLHEVERKERGVLRSEKCNLCLRPELIEVCSSKKLEAEVNYREIESFKWHKFGTYNGLQCHVFALDSYSLKVIERIHFTRLAVWNCRFSDDDGSPEAVTEIGDDLWLYTNENRLIVFKTKSPTEYQSVSLPRSTHVLWSSFSPDGSRLATCTSDGYINIWNVHTSQVEQCFKINEVTSLHTTNVCREFCQHIERSNAERLIACCWLKTFILVFDFCDRFPRLRKYPVDANLTIHSSKVQQVSLSHVENEFFWSFEIIDFSEGLLIFDIYDRKQVKVLDVNEVVQPQMLTLPGIKPEMSITVSPNASFVCGATDDCYYIWKRNPEMPAECKEVVSGSFRGCHDSFPCSFSLDSKVVFVFSDNKDEMIVYDTDARRCKRVFLEDYLYDKKVCFYNGVIVNVCIWELRFLDMDSGAFLASSYQPSLDRISVCQTKLSSQENVLAFPKKNGDMEFLRLCIPQDNLSTIKHEAATRWERKQKRKNGDEKVYLLVD